MEKTRFHIGMENLKEIDGKGGEAVIRSLETISPDLGKYIIEFAFGDIYERDGLSLQEREMITLASLLTAGGCEPQLEVLPAVHPIYWLPQSPECRFCGKKGI